MLHTIPSTVLLYQAAMKYAMPTHIRPRAIAYSLETEFLAFHLAKRQPVRKQWQWVKPRQAEKLGFLTPFFE